jgi:hypothetical protein
MAMAKIDRLAEIVKLGFTDLGTRIENGFVVIAKAIISITRWCR